MRLKQSLLPALVLMLCLCVRAHAQYGAAGATYSIEPWAEDWSYLKDQPPSNDPLDRLKYIPLNPDRDWYLTLGGQARWRMDYFNNSEFGAGDQSEGGFHLFRLLADADVHFGQNFRLFFQLNSGLVVDRYGGPRPGDADDFDIQQAFADWTIPFHTDDSVTFRVGRQDLLYGSQRLIGPNDWVNVHRTFEGFKTSISVPNDTLDLFLVRPVLIDKTRFNSGDDHTTFAGIYNVAAFPDQLPGAHAKLDTYLLLLDRSRSSTTGVAADSDIFTLGVRPHANPGNWDFDLEPDWQFGHVGSRAICAYSVALDGGYTFHTLPTAVRAGVGFDLASGSPDPGHRFNQLFPPTYMYLGHMYLFGRENLIDLHPELTIHLTDDLQLDLAQHFFWRQNTSDAVYNLSSEPIRPSASRARVIGNEFDISLYWQIQRHISAYAGYAHFFSGSFIQQTGAHADQDFAYASVTFTF